MLSRFDAETIIGDWIVYTTEHDLLEKKQEFWLLYDYLEDDFSFEYYRRHYEKVKNILESLDNSKEEVRQIKEYFLPIISKYNKRGFFAI